jgi:serine/threonine protein kinase/Tol biopolymer transport system component
MTDRLDQLKAALEGRYEIERELGHGGMATVYLANDIRHHRQVAVKVLRPDLAAALGPDRFLREIRIAANLTHPHILPLHDSGEAEGFLYYVMPYIKGQTLRERIEKEGELPVVEAVRIIREVTDALAFAHSQGVVHRDIKPDNVMLTGGHAIVADFGVAKAVSEATGRDKLTTAGVALGTPAYMSPEQATADPHVDHRADIYAVGAMAYEALAGRTPFTGATPQSVLAAHVTEQPDPVSKHRDQVSGELEAVIMKCLAKKPADRWQSADEMLPYLDASATPSGGLTPAGTRPVQAVSGPKKLFRPMALAGVVVLVVIVIFGSRLLQRAPLTITITNERQITSDLGIEFEPSLSPDGSKVVYSKGQQFRMHPFVQVLSGGATVPVAGDLPGFQRGPVWNTAGDSVVFWHWNTNTAQPGWAATAMLGGAIRTLDLVAARDKIAWSRDGASVAYGREDSLFIRTQGNERFLVKQGDGPRHMAWSPDGQRIAYVLGADSWTSNDVLGDIYGSAIWVVDAEGGEPVLVAGADGFNMNVSPVWLADGRHLLFVSDREASRAVYLVEIGTNGPVGSPRRVPGGADPHSISISADGGRLAYAKFNYTRNIFEYRLSPDGPVNLSDGERLTRGTEIIERIEISPDGEWIAFDSHINGNHDVFKMRRDGSGRTQLTSDPSDNFLRKWSPDGTELSVTARIGSVNGGGIVSSEGSSDAVRSFRDSEWGMWSEPAWSHTGLEILMTNQDEPGLWLSSRATVGEPWSEPVQVGESLPCDEWAEWSPDSDMFLCSYSSPRRGVLLATRAGETLWRYLADATAGKPWLARAQFSADGSIIYAYGVAPDGTQGIWAMPVTGGDPELVIVNDDPSLWANVFSFEVGPDDGIYLAVAEYQSDIWVMDLEY